MSSTTITSNISETVVGQITINGSYGNYDGSTYTGSSVAQLTSSISNDGIGGFSMHDSNYVTLPSVTERARITLPSVALDWSNSVVDPTIYTDDYSQPQYGFNVSVNWNLIIEDGALNELANVSYGSTNLRYMDRNIMNGDPGWYASGYPGTTGTLTPSTSTVIINRAGSNSDNRKITFYLKATPNVQTGAGGVSGTLL